MIEFYDDEGVLGTVKRDDEKLIAHPVVRSYVDTWNAAGRTARGFEDFYDAWSNGYISARRIEDTDTDT